MSYQNQYQQPVQQGGAFGWNDEIQKESSFVLLPEGDYAFTIEKFEKGRYAGGEKISACPKAIVTFRIHSPHGSVSLTENYLLHQDMEWKLSEFFAGIGMKQKDERVRMQWDNSLIGRRGVCKVIVHNYTKDGQQKQINRIDKLYPTWDQPNIEPVAPAVQPQSYGVPQQAAPAPYAAPTAQPTGYAAPQGGYPTGGWQPKGVY